MKNKYIFSYGSDIALLHTYDMYILCILFTDTNKLQSTSTNTK